MIAQAARSDAGRCLTFNKSAELLAARRAESRLAALGDYQTISSRPIGGGGGWSARLIPDAAIKLSIADLEGVRFDPHQA